MPPRTDPREVIFPIKKIRCVLAHDHVLLRQGLRRLLEDEPDIDVVGEAGNAAECLRKACEFRPDVLIADAGTFGLPAPEAEILLARESPQTKIVFLSMQERASSPFSGLRAAEGDCAARETSAEELVEMVRNSRRADRTRELCAKRYCSEHSDRSARNVANRPAAAEPGRCSLRNARSPPANGKY